MRRNNKGFTLIELIVTIAIMAIFSGVVLTMIGTGANSCRNTSSTAKAQMETQEVMDQIQNMIIDVNRSVYYACGKGTVDNTFGSEIRNDIDSGDNSQSKTFYACSASELDAEQKKYKYSCDVIEWDSDEQKLYYACRTWEGEETGEASQDGTDTQSAQGFSNNDISTLSADGEISDGTQNTTDKDAGTGVKLKRTTDIETKVARTVLAENITNFCVDVSKAQSERIVRFQFTTDKNGKQITTIHTVNLRNQVQIGKPDDGYGTADNGKAWIKITNYPQEITAGETLSGFSKLMNGNIDPSTVQWIVDSDNGSIAGQEDSEVSLTAAADATGEISVYVQARTTDGTTVVSQIVKISVKIRIPDKLIPDKKELLVAAGQGTEQGFTLSGDKITWSIRYNDGTEAPKEFSMTDLKYTIEENNLGITIRSDGSMSIPGDLGTDTGNSSFIVTVSYNDKSTGKTVKGKITIKLARLDLSQPTGIYHVGDTKPFEYIYKEGGVQTTLPDDQISKSVNGKVYQEGQKFIGDDIGKGTAAAEVNLTKRSGYGTLKAESLFEVQAAVINQQIKISDGNVKDTIVGGQNYYCSYYNRENFYFPMPLDGNWDYEITWGIKSKIIDGTGFVKNINTVKGNSGESHDNNNKDVVLYVGQNEKGFILTADMKIYHVDPKTKEKSVAYQYHGELNVKVITNIKIITPTDKVIRGRTYDLKAELCVWSVDKNNNHTDSTLDNGNQYVQWTAEKIQNLDNENKTWMIADSQKDTTLHVWINNNIPNVKNAKPNNLMINYPVKVENASCTLELKDSDGGTEKEIYPDETLDLSAIIQMDGKNYIPTEGISWRCIRQSNNENIGNVLSGNNLLGKTFSLPEHMRKEETYQVTVSFVKDSYNVVSNIYTIKVKKYTTNSQIVAINDKASLFPGDTTRIYLKLWNEKERLDASVNWSFSDDSIHIDQYNSYQGSVYNNGEIPIKLIAKSDITEVKNITVTANYTLGQKYNYETGSATFNIIITPLTMNLTMSTNQLYNGQSPATITADIVDVQHDQHVTDSYDIEWSLDPASDENYVLDQTNDPAIVRLSVQQAPQRAITVTIKAVAKDKTSGMVICTASEKITINPKTTVEKAYNCQASTGQKLEFNPEDETKKIQEIKTGYLTVTGDDLIECGYDKLPLLTFDATTMSIQMNPDTGDYSFYRYVKISVDMNDVLYNFYIYPLQNNVYDYEFGTKNEEAIAYVPADTDSIRKLCTLNDDYTYFYARTDAKGKNCQIRLSVYAKTGIGSFNGNYASSSANKWFMCRQDKKNEWIYYRLEGDKWYRFHNGKRNAQGVEKTRITRFYWDLKDQTHLYDDNGNDTKEEVENTYFWKKWN